VKNVYYLGNSGTMFERQSPYKEKVGVWGNDNFSGLYTTSNSSSLLSFWDQHFTNGSQILVVLFQEIGANSLTIGKYHSDNQTDYPWESRRQSIPIQDGSPLVMANVGVRFDMRLYLSDENGLMAQYQYNLQTDSLSRPTCECFDVGV
jgi:hypothetical protein